MSTLLTHDLRSEARDYGRVKAHNNKWSRGSRGPSGVRCTHNTWDASHCTDCTKRPNREPARNFTSLKHAENKKEQNRYHTMAKKVFRSEVVDAVDDNQDGLSDSSGDIDVYDASAAPELKEVMYSYDAPTGPTRGGEVLSYAITKAVQRFENNETEKIVKKEYDLVLDGKDEPESYVADADEDFELIDARHFK